MLLQQIAGNNKADCRSRPVIPQRVIQDLGHYHQHQYQCCRQLQPPFTENKSDLENNGEREREGERERLEYTREAAGEEETQDDGDEGDPFSHVATGDSCGDGLLYRKIMNIYVEREREREEGLRNR